jgi:hypothetical protein
MTNLDTILDLHKTEKEIKEIKYPLIFLFNLISHKNNFYDFDLSLVLRLFLKNHFEISMKYNLKKLLIDELDDYPITQLIITDFYKLLSKKLISLLILKKWRKIYNNKIFWEKNISEQIFSLNNLRNYFFSIYDCSKGGIPLHCKLGGILDDNNIIKNDIKERLKSLLKIFGINLFSSLSIPIISNTDFESFNSKQIIGYLALIFDKFNELLNYTIKIFENYRIVCNQLDGLLNPKIIKINSSNIDSETEMDDINLICK